MGGGVNLVNEIPTEEEIKNILEEAMNKAKEDAIMLDMDCADCNIILIKNVSDNVNVYEVDDDEEEMQILNENTVLKIYFQKTKT